MYRSQRLAWMLAALLAGFLIGCAKPLPDPDGNPGGARSLSLNEKQSDQLSCKNRRQPDCIDWYVVRFPDEREIDFEVTGTNPKGLSPDYSVILADHRADLLQRVSNEGRGEVRMSWSGEPGAYFLAISTGSTQTDLHYDVVARYEPPPPPEIPAPLFKTTSWMVLEVEAERGEPRFVVLDGGIKNGLRKGFRGRLIERDKPIAEIELVEVFEEGSRARIATDLEDQITPQTAAEIDVPIGGVP